MPRQLKIAVIFLTAALGVLLLAVAAYVLYVYLQYYRIDDGQILTVSSEKTDTIRTGKTYSVMTYNIGFGQFCAVAERSSFLSSHSFSLRSTL